MKTPFIWLQDGEMNATADCGCRVVDLEKFYLCPTHEAAPDLLKLLEDIAAEMDDDTTEKGVTTDLYFERRIRGAIKNAKGGE